ncbi:MAG TPA: hypothetical protein VNX65_02215 [Patescibacteria group bacterium]|jgi:hypothetical protein|nr:hypothetical protein [Patescibacteria group bacterium]
MEEPVKEDTKNSETKPKSYSGYGKRPLWQWIALYLVVGIVVYGLIYYFSFYNKKSGSTPYNNTTNSAPSNGLY